MERDKWVGSAYRVCSLKSSIQGVFSHTFDNLSDARRFLLLNNVSVFSFALLNLSSGVLENSDFEFEGNIASWPRALFLSSSRPSGTTAGFSIYGIISDSLKHLTSYGRFLWGIPKLVFQRHLLPRHFQLVLTSALFVHDLKSFAEQIYLHIFLAFAYPFFGATPSLLSYLRIGNISATFFWHKIIHLVLQRNSRISFLSVRTENTVLHEIELFIQQFQLSHIWQVNDCHPLELFFRDLSDFNDTLAIGVLRTCLLPYINNDVDITKLLSVDCLTEIMLSIGICRAFADYHPRAVVAIFEDADLVRSALCFCDRLNTLLGDSLVQGWCSRAFSLHQLCSDQIGIFGASLRTRWRLDWRIVNYFVGRLEQQPLDDDDIDDTSGCGRVPKLTRLACQAVRFALRLYLDGLSPPRPSFTAQIEDLKIPPVVKSIILSAVMED
ncbi:unnamed protein product [Hydatigera taeniaeformis]|uniref:SOCS box domain-containing protein n=1 Tax=Hydatigena taeniaeformis TaxID=6205 RepID=A0A0R3X2U2_HYDTA|nr:unnamed protein product [Hydatigera taeniaeformis]